MAAIARTLALMFAAPVAVLLIWAHLVRPVAPGLDLLAVAAALLIGIAGAATAPWAGRTKAIVATLYLVAAVPALPMLTLLSVCSTGDCL
jgi:hypothetical protein